MRNLFDLKLIFLSIAYAACFPLLHFVAAVFEVQDGASAFYPARGLSVFFAYCMGWKSLPILLVVQLFIPSLDEVMLFPLRNIFAAMVVSVPIAVAGEALRRFSFDPTLGRIRDVLSFLVVTMVAEAVITITTAVVKTQLGGDETPWSWNSQLILSFWVGDMTGILSVAPLSLVLSRAASDRHQFFAMVDAARNAFQPRLIALHIMFLVLIPGFASLCAYALRDRISAWYLILVPAAIIASRYLIGGAVVATTVMSFTLTGIVATMPMPFTPLDLQIIVFTILVIILLLGAISTERARAGAALASYHFNQARRAKQQADAVIAAKTRFLAATAHDVRQPLQALQLILESLSSEALSARAGQLVDQMRNSARGLSRLFDGLLDAARVSDEITNATIQPVRLATLFDDLASQALPEANRCKVTLKVCRTRAVVLSDYVLLKRCMANIVENAIKFNEPGGRVLVGVRYRKGFLRIVVADTGIGIAAADLERIFDDFVRLPAGRRKVGGTGLGLALVRQITARLGAEVEVRSRLGAGSSFALVVPLAPRSMELPWTGREIDADTNALSVLLRDRIVVVVDDDEAVRELLSSLLGQFDAAVVTASGKSELDIQIDESGAIPDLLITDLELNENPDGADLSVDLERRIGKALPTVFLTASERPKILRSHQALLIKPATLAQIAGAIEAVLEIPQPK